MLLPIAMLAAVTLGAAPPSYPQPGAPVQYTIAVANLCGTGENPTLYVDAGSSARFSFVTHVPLKNGGQTQFIDVGTRVEVSLKSDGALTYAIACSHSAAPHSTTIDERRVEATTHIDSQPIKTSLGTITLASRPLGAKPTIDSDDPAIATGKEPL